MSIDDEGRRRRDATGSGGGVGRPLDDSGFRGATGGGSPKLLVLPFFGAEPAAGFSRPIGFNPSPSIVFVAGCFGFVAAGFSSVFASTGAFASTCGFASSGIASITGLATIGFSDTAAGAAFGFADAFVATPAFFRGGGFAGVSFLMPTMPGGTGRGIPIWVGARGFFGTASAGGFEARALRVLLSAARAATNRLMSGRLASSTSSKSMSMPGRE